MSKTKVTRLARQCSPSRPLARVAARRYGTDNQRLCA